MMEKNKNQFRGHLSIYNDDPFYKYMKNHFPNDIRGVKNSYSYRSPFKEISSDELYAIICDFDKEDKSFVSVATEVIKMIHEGNISYKTLRTLVSLSD
jgi:hypothetical protein